MTLKEYQKKRKFKKTPEPKGEIGKTGFSRFVVHKHQARNLHFDFRLEFDSVLKSWAVPKGVPEEAGVKRLAVQTEDHPIEYIDFEGVIPEGQYGAGKVEVWDKGDFKLLPREKNHLEFELSGKKLKGVYILVQTKMGNNNKNWLMFKK